MIDEARTQLRVARIWAREAEELARRAAEGDGDPMSALGELTAAEETLYEAGQRMKEEYEHALEVQGETV